MLEKQGKLNAGFNRTFMELKFSIKKRPSSSVSGFNRTFMELKSEYQKIKFAGLDLF